MVSDVVVAFNVHLEGVDELIELLSLHTVVLGVGLVVDHLCDGCGVGSRSELDAVTLLIVAHCAGHFARQVVELGGSEVDGGREEVVVGAVVAVVLALGEHAVEVVVPGGVVFVGINGSPEVEFVAAEELEGDGRLEGLAVVDAVGLGAEALIGAAVGGDGVAAGGEEIAVLAHIEAGALDASAFNLTIGVDNGVAEAGGIYIAVVDALCGSVPGDGGVVVVGVGNFDVGHS